MLGLFDDIVPLLRLTKEVTQALASSAQKSSEDKRNYEEKLEQANGVDVYKYILLINTSALEGYVAQARLQAQQSFNLSRTISIAGFMIIVLAIGLSIFFTISGNNNLNSAYLAGLAGILTEFIAGVFFFLYSKTLTQINLFHDKLVDMQKTALSYYSNSESEDDKNGIIPLNTELTDN